MCWNNSLIIQFNSEKCITAVLAHEIHNSIPVSGVILGEFKYD